MEMEFHNHQMEYDLKVEIHHKVLVNNVTMVNTVLIFKVVQNIVIVKVKVLEMNYVFHVMEQDVMQTVRLHFQKKERV